MKIICSNYEETVFEVRILSEQATTNPRRKLRTVPAKAFEVKAAPAPIGPKPEWLMDQRPEHKATRKYK